MKIFITGATGFIGSHLVKRLAQSNHQMRCLVRKTSQAESLKKIGVELVVGDVTDKSSLLAGMEGCHWVFNLANIYSFWEPNNRVYEEVNVVGTRNVMESALEKGIAKVVHLSTVGIFGKPAVLPFTEDTPIGPVRFSRYTRTKYEGDIIAWDMYKDRGLPLVVIYPAAVLGPGDSKATGQYIMSLVRGKLPAAVMENSVMTFVYVGDVAECIVRAAEKEDNIGEKYIVGKFQLSFGELNLLVSDIAGIRLPSMHLPDVMVKINAILFTAIARLTKRPPLWGMSVDQMNMMSEGFRADGSKIEKELGINYTPIRVALEEAMKSYLK